MAVQLRHIGQSWSAGQVPQLGQVGWGKDRSNQSVESNSYGMGRLSVFSRVAPFGGVGRIGLGELDILNYSVRLIGLVGYLL